MREQRLKIAAEENRRFSTMEGADAIKYVQEKLNATKLRKIAKKSSNPKHYVAHTKVEKIEGGMLPDASLVRE